MLEVLNALVGEYSRLPAKTMFLKSLRLEFVRTTRKHLRAFNDIAKLVPNVELMCLTEQQLLLVKVHCAVVVESCSELLQARANVIVVHDDGSTSSNCLRLHQTKRSIKAVILPTTKSEDDDMLDSYLSMLDIFHQHLSIQVLAYQAINSQCLHPAVCMFDRLEEIGCEEQPTYIRTLHSAAHVSSFKQICEKVNGKELPFSCGRFCFTVVDPELQQPSVWLFLNGLPWLDFDSDLSRCSSLVKHMKYLRILPARIQGRLKSKYELEENPFSFIAIVNVTCPNKKQLNASLEACFREMYKELQLIGWRTAGQEQLTMRVQCLQDLCEMLALPPHGLLRSLLTKQ